MLISVLVLLVASSALTLLSKQQYFSRLYRQSQAAYYAADDALNCAIKIDDAYIGSDGLGIFPGSTTTSALDYINSVFAYVNAERLLDGLPIIADINDIKCSQSSIFNTLTPILFSTSTNFYQYLSVSNGLEEGVSSTFNMRMPIGGGEFRCAKVTVNKTYSFRQIIAQGYARCDDPYGSVERALVNTTVTE
jgi:hypothetical protein